MAIQNRGDRRTPGGAAWGVPDISWDADSAAHPDVLETKTFPTVQELPEPLDPHPDTTNYPGALLVHRKTSVGDNRNENRWLTYMTLPGAEVVNRVGNGDVIQESVTQYVVASTEPGASFGDAINGQSTTLAVRQFLRFINADGTEAASPIFSREYWIESLYVWAKHYWQQQRISLVKIASILPGTPGIITTQGPHGLVTGNRVFVDGGVTYSLATVTVTAPGVDYVLSSTPGASSVITVAGGTNTTPAQVTPTRVRVITAGIDDGGVGFAVNDTIDLVIVGGVGTSYVRARVLVTAESSGVVTAFTLVSGGEYSTSESDLTQAATSGSGTGFFLTGIAWGIARATVVEPGLYTVRSTPLTQASSTPSGTGATFSGTFNTSADYAGGIKTATVVGTDALTVGLSSAALAGAGFIRGPIPSVVDTDTVYGKNKSHALQGVPVDNLDGWVMDSELKNIEGSSNIMSSWDTIPIPPVCIDYPEYAVVVPGIFTFPDNPTTLDPSILTAYASALPGFSTWNSVTFVTIFGRPIQGFDYNNYDPPASARTMARRTRTYQRGQWPLEQIPPKFTIITPGAGSIGFPMIQDHTICPAFQWVAANGITYNSGTNTVSAVDSIVSAEKIEASHYPMGSNLSKPGETFAYDRGDIVVIDAFQEPIPGTNIWCRTVIVFSENENVL